jgi:DNA-binding MarR family transcriptional regulator
MPVADRSFMIGALLAMPSLTLSAHIRRRLQRRGFNDVTDASSAVLKVLTPEGDRITVLARKAAMTKQSMGYLVEQLAAAGYVERLPDPRDGRAVIVRRTKKGWAYNRAAAEEVAQLEEEWARLIGPSKMKQLKVLLNELVAKLGYAYSGSSVEYATHSVADASA